MGEEKGERTGPSRRAIIGWTAGMFAALALAWFATSTATAFRQTQAVVRELAADELAYELDEKRAVQRLGGEERAARFLSFYLRVPGQSVNERLCAIRLLQKCGPPAVHALVRASRDDDPAVRAAAVDNLGGWGSEDEEVALSALRDALADEDQTVRRRAALTLANIWYANDGVPELAKALSDQDISIRQGAADAIRWLGAQAAAAVPTLITTLKNKNPESRELAAWTLGKLAPVAQGATPALTVALADESASVRATSAWSLGEVKAKQPATIRALKKLLGDKAPRVRVEAAHTLAKLGEGNPAAASAVVAVLRNGERHDSRVWDRALDALPDMGVETKIATPLLIRAFEHNKGRASPVRQAAIRGLGEIAPAKIAVPLLVEALADEDSHTRNAAADALVEFGPEAKAAVPTLTKMLDDPCCRLDAARALASIGPEAKPAVSALVQALSDEHAPTGREAVRALGCIGPEARSAAPTLTDLLDDDDLSTNAVAGWALTRMGRFPHERVPLLLKALRSSCGWTRWMAVMALGELGPQAKAAVPQLKRALKDADADVRDVAAEALAKVQAAEKKGEK